MKRRKFILGTGAAASGGASLLGSGAFTSVAAERNIAINIAGDANALLRLAPCDGSPNGDYVTGASNGAIAIDLSGSNDLVDGSGVNTEALSVFDNVFEICNQGTQDVCVDFELDVPEIPGPVPDRYDFEAGDPAVVFYRGSNRDEYVSTGELNVDRPGAISLSINNGECQCIGFEVRAFGFDTGEDLFEETDLTIRADANGDCDDGVTDPDPIGGFQITQSGSALSCVEPIRDDKSVEEYYDWDNTAEYGNNGKYSARPAIQPDPGVSHVFLYRGGDNDLYLVMVHGDPEDGTYKNTFEFGGLPGSGSWTVKDDDPDKYDIQDSYATDEATWRWGSPRTDGGAYGPLDGCPDTDITITPPDGIEGIDEWKFLSGDGQEVTLDQTTHLTIECGCENP